jgi:predicted permease
VIYAAVKPIFKIYVIIGVGFYLARRNILTVSTCRDISDLIVSAILPCLLFNNVVSNLQSLDIKNIGIIFFTAALLFGVGALLAITTYFTTKGPKRWFGGLLSVGLFPNISDLPIAYLQTLSKGGALFTEYQGDRGVAFVCIFVAAQIFMQFSLGLYKLIQWDFRDELLPKDTDEKSIESSDQSEVNVEKKSSIKDSVAQCHQQHSSRDDSSLLSMESDACHNRADTQHTEFLRLHALEQQLSRALSISTSTSVHSQHPNILQMVPSRTAELRQQKTETIDDVINEFSDYERTKCQRLGSIYSQGDLSNATQSTYQSIKTPKASKFKTKLIETLKNFLSPNSLALIISIIIAMTPPLKALFVPVDHPHIPPAPDLQPPLSFVIDITSYMGAASVPLGLLLLGATISRLKVNKLYPGFWKTAAMITCSRLIVLPIFGVGLTTGLHKAGWYDDDLIRFVSVLEFGVPSATSLVYFTAFYTDPNSDDHLQMDCLAISLIFQYMILFITLPFLVTFTLKVSMGY